MADPTEEDGQGSIEAAVRRLERASALLESRIKTLTARAAGGAGGLFESDRAQLASELDLARSRERELATAGAEASEALGRAIAGIRAALERGEAH
jgi:hypothetical protein